jgi:hypothetical protein
VTTEIRSQLNVRLSSEANLSVSVATFVDTEEEAREAGARNADFVTAYLDGYNRGFESREDA